MNKEIEKLVQKTGVNIISTKGHEMVRDGCYVVSPDRLEEFTKAVIEETLRQVDERCYGRGENQWYYEDDKQWVRLHFGYGALK